LLVFPKEICLKFGIGIRKLQHKEEQRGKKGGCRGGILLLFGQVCIKNRVKKGKSPSHKKGDCKIYNEAN
jgi:hypothetical protein